MTVGEGTTHKSFFSGTRGLQALCWALCIKSLTTLCIRSLQWLWEAAFRNGKTLSLRSQTWSVDFVPAPAVRRVIRLLTASQFPFLLHAKANDGPQVTAKHLAGSQQAWWR